MRTCQVGLRTEPSKMLALWAGIGVLHWVPSRAPAQMDLGRPFKGHSLAVLAIRDVTKRLSCLPLFVSVFNSVLRPSAVGAGDAFAAVTSFDSIRSQSCGAACLVWLA